MCKLKTTDCYDPIPLMRKLTLLVAVLIFTLDSEACSCNWGGNFIHSSSLGELVIKGKVIARTYHLENGERYTELDKAIQSKINNKLDEFYGMGESITIEVLELIRGTESRRTIEVFDSDGGDCRVSTKLFELGKTYIIATYKPNRQAPKLPNETLNDYAIGGCSENWIEYLPDSDSVKGMIKGKSIRKRTRSMSYAKLLESIKES